MSNSYFLKTYRLAAAIIVAVCLICLVLIALPEADTIAAPEARPMEAPLQARATDSISEILVTGVIQSLDEVSGDSQQFANTGKEFVLIQNDYTARITATFITSATYGGFEIEDQSIGVDAGETVLIGPFNTGIFDQKNGTDAGNLYWSVSSVITGYLVASVTYRVYLLDDGE